MTTRSLYLAKDLRLPLDAVTQTFLIVGKRGSGKSNTAARFVEQLHRARLPFVVLDPVDTWWGLKAGANGGEGLGVYVFGGRHQDLPLEPGGGALIADVLCEHRMPMVLSVKHLSGRERSAFMVAFAQTLFQKWGGGPLHVVLEEAHELAPQMAGARSQSADNEAAMLGAFKRLWKLGRASGIGGTAVTQRPASLSKDITTQSEILIAHRTIGPQDVKAIGEWVKYHGQHEAILGELPTLPTGEAFVWAPEFPEGEPLGLRRTTILRRETYDSASTPKVGEQRVEPKELAAVDLDRLRSKMAATIEKAKAEDPKELRKRIVELERQAKLSKAGQIRPAGTNSTKPALTDTDRALLEKWASAITESMASSAAVLTDADARLNRVVQKAVADYLQTTRTVAVEQGQLLEQMFDRIGIRTILEKLPAAGAAARPLERARRPELRGGAVPTPRPRRQVEASRSSGSGDLAKGERIVLTAIAQYPDGVTREQLSILTGYKRSTRDAYVQRLSVAGYVDAGGELVRATAAGVEALGDFEPLPTGDELRAYWLRKLPAGERVTLEAIIQIYPETADREAISELTGYKRSTRDAYIQRLQSRKIVMADRNGVRASEELFG